MSTQDAFSQPRGPCVSSIQYIWRRREFFKMAYGWIPVITWVKQNMETRPSIWLLTCTLLFRSNSRRTWPQISSIFWFKSAWHQLLSSTPQFPHLWGGTFSCGRCGYKMMKYDLRSSVCRILEAKEHCFPNITILSVKSIHCPWMTPTRSKYKFATQLRKVALIPNHFWVTQPTLQLSVNLHST